MSGKFNSPPNTSIPGANTSGWFRARAGSHFWLQWGLERLRAGYELDALGASDLADRHYREVIDELERLRGDGESALTDEIIGGLALRHGIRLLSFGKLLSAEAALLTALHSFQSTLSNDCHVGRVREIAQTASWLAVARKRQGDLHGAVEAFDTAIRSWRSVLQFDGTAHGQRLSTRSFTATLHGYAKVLRRLGDAAGAERATDEARLLHAHAPVSH